MALPKGSLKTFMQASKIIKPEEIIEENFNDTHSEKSKLKFRRSFPEPNASTDISNTTRNISKNISLPEFSMLSGCEKIIFITLSEAKDKIENGMVITKQININKFCVELNIPASTIKKSIQRLEKKKYLIRIHFKSGRDGWTIYSIPNQLIKNLVKET